jgi:hypothetical protein
MWLAPTGYCFLQQAGSVGNDAFGAVLALAAVDFAMRAQQSRDPKDLWLSVLAAALMTGAKTSNLTLLLPWLIAIWPSLRLLWARPLMTIGVVAVAAMSSFLPMAAINYHRVGDWTGAAYEVPEEMRTIKPLVALAGNTLNLTAQNLTPGVFPPAGWWNEHAYKLLPRGLLAEMEHSFEPGGAHVKLSEIQYEPDAGLGFGVTLLILLSYVCARKYRSRENVRETLISAQEWRLALVRWSPWVCLLVFMVKMSMSASSRIIAPYYCLLLPFFLKAAGQEVLVGRLWWKAGAGAVFALALLQVVVNPPRPLWPAQTVLGWLAQRHPSSQAIARGKMLYDFAPRRGDALAEVRQELPPQERIVGFIYYMDFTPPMTSLWRPFFQRRIQWVQPTDSLEAIVCQGIHYVIIAVESPACRKAGVAFEDWFQPWLRSHDAKVIAQKQARILATRSPASWYVVELPPGK